MANMTIAIPDELHARMKEMGEVRWSEVARTAFENKLRDYEIIDAFAKRSDFTQKDIDEFAELINKRASMKLNKQCV